MGLAQHIPAGEQVHRKAGQRRRQQQAAHLCGQGRSGVHPPQPGQQQAGRQRPAPEQQPEPELVKGLHQRLEGQHRQRGAGAVRVHEHEGQVFQQLAQAYPVQQPGEIHQRRGSGAAEKGQHRPPPPMGGRQQQEHHRQHPQNGQIGHTHHGQRHHGPGGKAQAHARGGGSLTGEVKKQQPGAEEQVAQGVVAQPPNARLGVHQHQQTGRQRRAAAPGPKRPVKGEGQRKLQQHRRHPGGQINARGAAGYRPPQGVEGQKEGRVQLGGVPFVHKRQVAQPEPMGQRQIEPLVRPAEGEGAAPQKQRQRCQKKAGPQKIPAGRIRAHKVSFVL